jgi:hypothetical protein
MLVFGLTIESGEGKSFWSRFLSGAVVVQEQLLMALSSWIILTPNSTCFGAS